MGTDLLTAMNKISNFRKANPKCNINLSLTIEGRDLMNKLTDRFARLVGPDGVKTSASLIIETLIRICFNNLSGLGLGGPRVEIEKKAEEIK